MWQGLSIKELSGAYHIWSGQFHRVYTDCVRWGCTPRPKTLPKGWGVQNPRLREISRAEGGVFSNASRLEAVYDCTYILSALAGSIDFVVWQQMALASVRLWFANKKPIKRNPFHTFSFLVLAYIFYHRNSFLPNNEASVSFLDFFPGNNRWRCHQSGFQFKYLLKTIQFDFASCSQTKQVFYFLFS